MKAIFVSDDLTLMDRPALSQWFGRSVHTIRAKCSVHSYDEQGRAMYDVGECEGILLKVPRSGRHAA
jgi:hypothetical protein